MAISATCSSMLLAASNALATPCLGEGRGLGYGDLGIFVVKLCVKFLIILIFNLMYLSHIVGHHQDQEIVNNQVPQIRGQMVWEQWEHAGRSQVAVCWESLPVHGCSWAFHVPMQ